MTHQPPEPGPSPEHLLPETKLTSPPPAPPADTSFGDGAASSLATPPEPPAADELPGERTTPHVQAAGYLPAQAGRYRIEGEIARGGMGAVLRAFDPDCNRTLAVKVLLDRHGNHPDLERRFLAEAQLTAQLQHPGIPPVHDIGRFDGRPFFCMKLIEGRTLAELLNERRSPAADLPRFLNVFGQVCETVAYAHSRGVLHRDLKPSNVMVGAFGEVQVMDWGLAKCLGGEPDGRPAEGAIRTARTETTGASSAAGSVLGTPAFMAPEQARGEMDRIDRRSDVFGLGAILCVVLTGRPPYTGPSGETLLAQAARAESGEAMAELDRCGAEEELVRLAKACLAAEPERRPADAGAVAAAVGAYQAGVQERLRRAELARTAAEVRAAEERKRRRLGVGLTAAAAALLLLLGGGAVGLFLERDRQRGAAEAALEKAQVFQRLSRWEEAAALLEQAEGRLGVTGPAPLRGRVARALTEVKLAARLDGIRLERIRLIDGKYLPGAYGPRYAEALSDAGLSVEEGDVSATAARVRDSGVRDVLVAALDDWALVTDDEALRARLLRAAREADPDPWRDRARDPDVWRDRKALEQLASEADAAGQPAALLAVLARRLYAQDGDPVPLLRAAQRRHPTDFWINYHLGTELAARRDPAALDEAAGFLRAALVARPDSAGVLNNLGGALAYKGDLDGALAAFRRAAELEPKNAHARTNQGYVLRLKGDPDGALAALRESVALDPNMALTHFQLGRTLHDKGDPAGAVAAFRRSAELDPKDHATFHNLGAVLHGQKDLDAALAAYRKAVELNPKYALAHYGVGAVLHDRGELDGAAAAYREARTINPRFVQAHYSLGVALADKGDADGAAAAYRAAVEVDPRHARAHGNLGSVLVSKGDLDGAVASYRRALAVDPKLASAHGGLGQALLRQGHFADALAATRRYLELAPAGHPARAAAERQLARCERLLAAEPKLADVLRGTARPADADEQAALAEVCRARKRYAAAARFYADAFAARPSLAADPSRSHRYDAACAAARAAAGEGEDADTLSGEERARWRRHALDWLRAELTTWPRSAEADRAAAQRTLRRWQYDPDLAGVRDPAALGKLPDAERDAWRQLWADVDALLQRVQPKE